MPKKRNVLIVDDQQIVSNAMKMVLKLDGHEVKTAESGAEALELIANHSFDLVFTDFEMPGMNGHELASIIKRHNSRQPIIMVTAYVHMADDIESLPHVDLIIGKPWSVAELRAAIEKLLPAEAGRNQQIEVA